MVFGYRDRETSDKHVQTIVKFRKYSETVDLSLIVTYKRQR